MKTCTRNPARSTENPRRGSSAKRLRAGRRKAVEPDPAGSCAEPSRFERSLQNCFIRT